MQKISLNRDTLEKVNLNENDCVNCKKCFNICPMMKEYGDSPKSILKSIYNEKSIDKNIPFSCMLCNACVTNCPKDIDLKSMFYDIRTEITKQNPKELKDLGYNKIKFHQKSSFSPVFSKGFVDKGSQKIFFPGCSLSSYSRELVMKTYEYLKEHIEDISIVFGCCGKPTLDIGDSSKFEKYYSEVDKLFKNNEISEVIVACPNCFNTIKRNSPGLVVTPIWSVINKYGVTKSLENHYKDLDIQFSLHDPCPVREEVEIHKDVRSILNSLGVNIAEFDNNRGNTECCGSGGMVRVTNSEISVRQTNKRASEAKTDNIVTYCESCCESMLSCGKSTLHVLDFIFNDDVINKKKFTQREVSFLGKWANRYKLKKEMEGKNDTK